MHGKRFIHLEAAAKHKQAKQGSLGTELAPHAKHKFIEAGVDLAQRERCLRLTLTNTSGHKVTNLQHSIVKCDLKTRVLRPSPPRRAADS